MASTISWLDSSVDEQLRMREIIGLFTEREGREELGLGQIRDALSDALFPGTSSLHTRARYLLFVPWTFQMVSEKRGSLEDARLDELRLIQALKSRENRESGIIGVEAGRTLKSVPSSIYWSALGTFQILATPQINREQAIDRHGRDLPDGGKLAVWRSSLPKIPHGFPKQVPNGMNLTREEAVWLQERIIHSVPNTLLAYLAQNPPSQHSVTAWEDVAAMSSTGAARKNLDHAQRFSETILGAQLLYNLLVAEAYESEGFTVLEGRVEHYRGELNSWAANFDREMIGPTWDLYEFFDVLTTTRGGSPIPIKTRKFVEDWVSILEVTDPHKIIADSAARKLVRDRESQNKGSLARIGNPKRLETWGGSSVANKLNYRWPFVKQILADLHAGLSSTPGTSDEVSQHA